MAAKKKAAARKKEPEVTITVEHWYNSINKVVGLGLSIAALIGSIYAGMVWVDGKVASPTDLQDTEKRLTEIINVNTAFMRKIHIDELKKRKDHVMSQLFKAKTQAEIEGYKAELKRIDDEVEELRGK